MKQISFTKDYEGVRLSMDIILKRNTVLKEKLVKIVNSKDEEKSTAIKEFIKITA